MNTKDNMKIDIAGISQVGDKNTIKEDVEVYEGEEVLRKIKDILNLYKDDVNKYNYRSITKEHMKELLFFYSTLHWIDQIRFRLSHLEFSELVYPQIKDSDGFKFLKKNHEISKKKITVYYYCEAYKSCTVGINRAFPKSKTQ